MNLRRASAPLARRGTLAAIVTRTRLLPSLTLALLGALAALPGDAAAQTAASQPRTRPLPIVGAVRIGGDDAAHPYTNRAALATRSRPGRSLTSYDLPPLTNVHQTARNVLLAARGFMGTPYVWGGTSPGGFDCSGFTKYVFGLVGVSIPRNSRQQLDTGTPVPARLEELVPGDLMFFANSRSQPVSHVGIYAGEGRMIHASGRGREVRVDDLRTKSGAWYATHMVAVRRVLDTPAPTGASQ